MALAPTRNRSLGLSLLVHGVLIAAAWLAAPVPARLTPAENRLAVAMPEIQGEFLEVAASPEPLREPVVDLPKDPIPTVEETLDLAVDPADDPALDSPSEDEEPRAPLPEGLSLAIIGRRTRPQAVAAPEVPPAPAVPAPAVPVRAQPSPRVAVTQPPRAARPAAGAPHAPLRLLHRPPFTAADYPLAARQAGAEGTAYVRIVVGMSGGVVSASLLESAGHPALDDDALRQVRLVRFAPLDSPRAVRFPVVYRLD